jgi:hypothetical protein
MRWLLGAFQDKRYIRIADKPLMLIYRAGQLPDPLRTTMLWREEARKKGVADLFLCGVESFREERTLPTVFGFDAMVEFQPDWVTLDRSAADLSARGNTILDYATFVEQQMQKPEVSFLRFPSVTPRWDNSPRRDSHALILTGSNPELYARWLYAAVQKANKAEPDKRLVFVNAWNEWGEGNHLEPDMMYGKGYLEATKRVMSGDWQDLGPHDSRKVIEYQRKRIRALEQDLSFSRRSFKEQERWAHELESIVREQQATLGGYRRLLGPLVSLARALRLNRRRD